MKFSQLLARPEVLQAATSLLANIAGHGVGQPTNPGQPPATPAPIGPDNGPYNPYLGYAAVDYLRPEVKRPEQAVVQVYHRGLHDVEPDRKPENSIGAFDAAVREGATFYEVDLRGDKNGEPILTHDEKLGREGDFGAHQGLDKFNPYEERHPPGPDQSKVNPDVRDITADDLRQWGIKQRNLEGTVTDERLSTLRDLLEHNRENRISVGIMADIKDIKVLQKSWEILATTKDHLGVPYSESAVLKIGLHKMPSVEEVQQVFNTTHYDGETPDWKHVKLQFVVVTMTVGNKNFDPQKQEYGEEYVLNSVKAHAKMPYNYGFEIGLKQEGGNLQTTKDWVQSEKLLLSHFQPVSEHDNPAAHSIGGEFFDADGYCCSNLSSKLFDPKGKNVPADTEDRRHLASFMLENNFQVITTDNPTAFGEAIRAAGKLEYKDFDLEKGRRVFNEYVAKRTPPVTPSLTTPELATRTLSAENPHPGEAVPALSPSRTRGGEPASPQPGASATLQAASARATPTPQTSFMPTRTQTNMPPPPQPGPGLEGAAAQPAPTPPPFTGTRTQPNTPPTPQPGAGLDGAAPQPAPTPTPTPSLAATRTRPDAPRPPQPGPGIEGVATQPAPTPPPFTGTRTQPESPPQPQPQSRALRAPSDTQATERRPQQRTDSPKRTATTPPMSPSPGRSRGM